MKKKELTVEKAQKKLVFLHYLEEIVLLAATVLTILMSDILNNIIKGSYSPDNVVHFNLVNIIASSLLALTFYGKRYSNFKDLQKNKPPFLLRLSDAIIYGIGFKGIIGIASGG